MYIVCYGYNSKLIFLPVISTVNVVELDPARLVAVATYVPA